MSSPTAERVAELRLLLHRTLRERLPPVPERWALMPAPLHGNVGDSAILLGTLEALTELGWPRPTVIADHETFDLHGLERRLGSGPIVFMGGGNFGDLYPREHEVRELVLGELPNNPAVQLPQSIHFSSPAAAAATARLLAARRDVPVLVRDEQSLAWAREHVPLTAPTLCPDMAFGLGTLPRPEPTVGVVRLLRRDAESSRSHGDDERDGRAIDWLTDDPSPAIAAEAWLRRLGRRRAPLRPFTGRVRSRLHRPMATARLRRGIALLGRGRTVITDRLHGHILSVMAGIPHAVIEDRHGKVAAFVRAWTEELPTVRLCETLDEAEEAVRELADGAKR